jgi:predicted dehydrogenase
MSVRSGIITIVRSLEKQARWSQKHSTARFYYLKEFFDWLTDPVRNGAGALFDFGCYGANLMTWLMDGQRPIAVTAVTQHFQPNVYPAVEDEATILVEYPAAQGIIQASWNWPFDRKDMEIYGRTGQIFALRKVE